MEMLMDRILITSKEVTAASIILVPILFLYHKIFFHDIKKTAAYIFFSLYLANPGINS